MVACRRFRRGLAPIIAMSFCFLMSSVPGVAEDLNSEAAQHFAAAQQAQNEGQLDRAAQEYLNVIHLLPDAAEAYASLGLVYNAQGKYAQSALALTKAENLKPGLPGVSLYLGIDYLKQHEPTQAIPHLQRSVRVEPKNEQVYTWLSQAYSDEDRLDPALEYLQKASGLFPSDPILLLDLGQLYRRAADEQIELVLTGAAASPLRHIVYGDIYRDEQMWQNARAHYFRALEQDPEWHGAHFGLGEIAFQNKEFDLATEEYQKELQVDPKSAAAMAKLAEIALLNGKPSDSLPLLKSALAVSPGETAHALGIPPFSAIDSFKVSKNEEQQLRAGLPDLTGASPSAEKALAVALVEHLLGQDDLSMEAWKRFGASTPRQTSTSPYRRAVIDFDAGQLNTAEANLNSWLGAHTLDYQARYLLAQTYHSHSREALEKLLATAPDSYPAHQALAEIYQRTQKNDQALAEYALVERMAPNLTGIHLAVGGILLKMHRPDQALPALEDELRLNPDSAEANADLGEIYLERTESAKAIPYLERAVKEDPKLQSAHQELGRAYYAQKQYTKAIVQLQDAAQHDLDGSVHFQLGLIYRATGQGAKAGEEFEISRKLKLDSLSHSESEMATFQKLSQ
jgi:tetratricopeptide (TPR) repeat protein